MADIDIRAEHVTVGAGADETTLGNLLGYMLADLQRQGMNRVAALELLLTATIQSYGPDVETEVYKAAGRVFTALAELADSQVH